MKSLLHSLVILIFIGQSLSASSSHLLGGQITYTHVSGNDFEVTCVLWRDMSGISLPGSVDIAFYEDVSPYNPANIFSGSNMISLPMISANQLALGDSCFTQTGIDIEEGKYRDIITIPNNTNGYYVIYDDCCRNGAILNIQAPSSAGFSVVTEMPDPALMNSSPNPGSFPSDGFFCSNILRQLYDISATDADGDSLVYSLVTPLDDGNPIKPFTEINWAPPYSLSDVIGGPVPMSIDSVTGIITAQSDVSGGTYVFGIQVEEYRNGIKIGQVRYDYQFISVQCPTCVATCTVGHYDFTGTTDDLSGFDNHGTLNGPGYDTDRFGQPYALDFNGFNDQVTIPNSSSLNVTDEASFSAWVRFSDTVQTNMVYGTVSDADRSVLFGLDVNEKPQLALASSSPSSWDAVATGPTAIDDFQWHHIVGVYDGTGMQIYVDNVENTTISGTVPPFIRVPSADYCIGGFQSGNYFNGRIDDVRIFACALDSAQVDSLYTTELMSIEGFSTKTNVNIYPNPARSTLNISGAFDTDVRVDLRNIRGELVRRFGSINEGSFSTTFNVGDLKPGVYLLMFEGESQRLVRRVILE